MFYRVCWVCWAVGAILVVSSRMGWVSPDLGWMGFYVASVAAVLTYLRGAPAASPVETTYLTRDMVGPKNHAYEQAIERFRRGETIFYEGLAFGLHKNGSVFLVAVASRPPADMDEVQALQDAERAVKGFGALLNLAPEIGSVANDRALYVSLVSEFGERGVEICHVGPEGQLEWKIRGKEERRAP
jgi:hypothetical protein